MLLSLFIYTFCWVFSYSLVNSRYNNLKKLKKKNGLGVSLLTQTPKKMPFWMLFLIAVLFTSYNFYLTNNSVGMAADRQNYLYDFEGGRQSESAGLIGVIGIIHLLGGSFDTLLYVSSLVSILFPLLAYRYSKDANPLSLLLFFLSLYILTSFTALKQCYTSGLSSLALVLLLQYRTKIKEIVIWLLMILAMLFHPTGYILIPIYIFVRFFKTNYNAGSLIAMFLLFSILFEPLMQFIGSTLSFLPFFSGKIDEYFGSEADKWEDHGVMSVFKGLPFYYIVYLGVKWRTKLKQNIEYNDVYLLLVILCSFFFIMNVYNYWMSRFMYLFLLVVYIYFGQMIKYIPNKQTAIFLVVLMTAVITYRDFYLIYTLYGGI